MMEQQTKDYNIETLTLILLIDNQMILLMVLRMD